VICSANELQAALQKAVRASGVPNALADEIAVAGAWLAARGADGIGAVLSALEPALPACATIQGDPPEFIDTRVVLAGPSALDLLAADTSREIALQDCDVPLLLAGLAAIRSEADGVDYRIYHHGVVQSTESLAELSHPDLLTLTAVAATESAGSTVAGSDIHVDPDAWQHVLSLAAAMYVPSSEQSRTAGAGAGLLDND
jgi:hypothetical protein